MLSAAKPVGLCFTNVTVGDVDHLVSVCVSVFASNCVRFSGCVSHSGGVSNCVSSCVIDKVISTAHKMLCLAY